MKVTNLKALIIVLIIALAAPASMLSDDTELVQIFRHFKNYRFGTVSLYEVTVLGELKRAIESKQPKQVAAAEGEEVIKEVDADINQLVDRSVLEGNSITQIKQDILNRGYSLPPGDVLQKVYDYYVQKYVGGGQQQRIERAYLITPRPVEAGEIPNDIYALIVSYETSALVSKNLRSVGKDEIFSKERLDTFTLDQSYGAKNLYELMMNAIVQGAVENRTLEMQGIGEFIFANKTHGFSEAVEYDPHDVQSYDIQRYVRISEGQPEDFYLKENQLIVSPDFISWKKYSVPKYYNEAGELVIDSFAIVNNDLPDFGIELKYGIDNINFPSFWSERITAYALWKNVKLGVILPTSGYAGLSEDVFDQTRTMTHGGAGIAGEMDFPIKIIPQSGIFHTSFGYVFGDAQDADYKDRVLDPLEPGFDPNVVNNLDYLVRANASLHYSFGIKIDRDYLMRFHLGATIYNVESWHFVEETDDFGITEYKFSMLDDESIFGVSGKIEFMTINVATPYGASVSYFDEAIGAHAWMQIPIVDETFALRLEAKGYFAAFRGDENMHPWERESIFIPMARFVIFF